MNIQEHEANQAAIAEAFNSLRDMVLAKNDKYQDSALQPMRIFSKVPADVSIDVRLDDKLSRIARASMLRKNDMADLIGYSVLRCVANGWTDFSDLID